MSNPAEDLIAGFQDLIGQTPEVLQPLIIALAGAVPYIEGEGSALIGVVGGLNPFVAAISAAAGNLICVVLVVLLGARIRTAVVGRRTRPATRAPAAVMAGATVTAEAEVVPAGPESKGRQKIRRWLVRFGVPGASLLAPIALPTPFTAATLVASGVGKGWVILWQAIAIILWTTVVTVGATLFVTAAA